MCFRSMSLQGCGFTRRSSIISGRPWKSHLTPTSPITQNTVKCDRLHTFADSHLNKSKNKDVGLLVAHLRKICKKRRHVFVQVQISRSSPSETRLCPQYIYIFSQNRWKNMQNKTRFQLIFLANLKFSDDKWLGDWIAHVQGLCEMDQRARLIVDL